MTGQLVWLHVLLVCLLPACSRGQQPIHPKHFRVDEFVGLAALGQDYSSVVLDYELESKAGGVIHFKSCKTVDATAEGDVTTRQFSLFQLLRANCVAARYYHHAPRASRALLPPRLSSPWLQQLPGDAVPNLGGNSLDSRDETLLASHPHLKVVASTAHSAEVRLSNEIEVTYLVLARGDFNEDGAEEALLRLNWAMTTAFGKGVDLIMLSQPQGKAVPSVIWRAGEPLVGRAN